MLSAPAPKAEGPGVLAGGVFRSVSILAVAAAGCGTAEALPFVQTRFRKP